jgi:hypothetical protein
MGEYKKQQALVKSLITRRQELEKQLVRWALAGEWRMGKLHGC